MRNDTSDRQQTGSTRWRDRTEATSQHLIKPRTRGTPQTNNPPTGLAATQQPPKQRKGENT